MRIIKKIFKTYSFRYRLIYYCPESFFIWPGADAAWNSGLGNNVPCEAVATIWVPIDGGCGNVEVPL